MIGSSSKVLRVPRPILFVGFILLFAVVLFCHYSSAVMPIGEHIVSECTLFASVHSITSSKDTLALYGILLISLIAAAGAARLQTILTREKAVLSVVSLWRFSKTNRYLSKLFDPLFEALRTGILHPQIYNPVFIAN